MSNTQTGYVYLQHLAVPIGNPDNPRAMAQHYIGWAYDVEARSRQHQAGHGAKLLAFAASIGVEFHIVRVWEGDRKLERTLKNKKNARKLCPEYSGGINT